MSARIYCPDEVVTFNLKLGTILETKYRMSLATWKTVKWLAVSAGIYAIIIGMGEGGDPLVGIIAIALILGGPELLEYLAVREDAVEYVKEQRQRTDTDEEG